MNNEYDDIDDNKITTFKGKGGFVVPDGYFDQSRNAILALALASAENPAQLSNDYFERSRIKILSKSTSRKAKISVWFRKPLFRYTAAAVVIFSIATIFWFQMPGTNTIDLANISDEEILEYLQTTDLKDLPMSEVSFASSTQQSTAEETYIISQTDEQTLLDEL
jgi:hypothetical protein